jgi:hypothetical protein
MANTFTVSHDDVFGATRIRIGTLTMTDGAAGSSASVGFNSILFAVDNSATQANISHTGGKIIACTAASGATFQVMVVGR